MLPYKYPRLMRRLKFFLKSTSRYEVRQHPLPMFIILIWRSEIDGFARLRLDLMERKIMLLNA